MPLLAVGLVLVSCVLHAVWNLLIKRARDKTAFTVLYLFASAVLYLPLFLVRLPHASIPPAGWLCIVTTGVVYVGYFLGLARAYRDGDLSFAYPFMRGLGPALAFVGGMVLLAERPTFWGSLGVGLILLGVFALNWQPDGERRVTDTLRAITAPSSRAALFVGVMYGCYSLSDKLGVGVYKIDPPVYIYLTFTISLLLIGPWVLWKQGAETLRAEWRINKGACLVVGTLNVLAYLMVLYALSLPGAPVSYIVPLRTTSVLIGVLLGVFVLGEGRPRARLAVGIVMMAGITLIAWKG